MIRIFYVPERRVTPEADAVPDFVLASARELAVLAAARRAPDDGRSLSPSEVELFRALADRLLPGDDEVDVVATLPAVFRVVPRAG